MKKCRVVGLTGRSGSGKSTVSSHYAAQGYPVLDGDLISREVTKPGSDCLAALVEVFGGEILQEDGSLDRAALATLAFAQPEATQKLVRITHPAIIAKLLEGIRQAEKQGARLVFVDGAVIVGAPFERYCDALIVVTAPERESLLRIMLRDGISKEAARRRLSAQLPEEKLRAAADYVLENRTSQAALLRQADGVLQQLMKETGKYEGKTGSDPAPDSGAYAGGAFVSQ